MLLSALLECRRKSFAIWYMILRQSPKSSVARLKVTGQRAIFTHGDSREDGPLDSSQVDLPGSEIASIELDQGTLRISFGRAYILKSMTGSKERTRWWQAGTLVIEGVEEPLALPQGPLVCAGGDIEENVYTYRDMIPIPLASRGAIRCLLRFEGRDDPLIASGRAIRLEMTEAPKYIEHLGR
jgi:hypothetical protein